MTDDLRCTCGYAFTEAEWAAARLVGIQPAPEDFDECDCGAGPLSDARHLPDCAGHAYEIELKNCPSCSSTCCRRIPREVIP